MTNGEKIKEIFPDINIYEHGSTYSINNEYNFNATWWNAEYKEPTKNDLGVDLISRADVNRLICEYRDDATETGNERDLERAYGANAVGELISELPSVTPQEPRKGKWTKISNTVPCMNCPICGSTFTLIQGGNKMHYCPNCGAKMSEE